MANEMMKSYRVKTGTAKEQEFFSSFYADCDSETIEDAQAVGVFAWLIKNLYDDWGIEEYTFDEYLSTYFDVVE